MSNLMGMLTTIQSYVWGPSDIVAVDRYRALLYD